MGIKNYLIEGYSGTGKTTVAEELKKRGYHVLDGDRELKYRGNPETGERIEEPDHKNEFDKAVWRQKHLIWNLEKVTSIINDHSKDVSFFCGGSRNHSKFIGLLDGVFILNVDDLQVLFDRMDERVARDPTDFGGKPEEKELVRRIYESKQDIPQEGTIIDSTQPLDTVIEQILEEVTKI